MNTFTFTELARIDTRSGLQSGGGSTLILGTGINPGGCVVTFGMTCGRNAALSCENTEESHTEFVKRSFFATLANPYIVGLHNTGSCAQKRIDVVTFLSVYFSRKNAASVALPVNQMMARTYQANIFTVVAWAVTFVFLTRGKSSAVILQTTSQPIAANIPAQKQK